MPAQQRSCPSRGATLAAPPVALSAEADWTPSGELGFVNTTGNSEATTINGKLAVEGRYDGFKL